MSLQNYDISNPYTAVVKSSDRITPTESDAEVRHIVLDVADGAFEFVEGQSIGVLVPGPHEFGNKHHLRLYSIASTRRGESGEGTEIGVAVRRCYYIDEVSGEKYPGVASNYLCDVKPGDKVTISGPYGSHFTIPRDETSNLLMIGVGTGIAPFRAFTKHIYAERGGWKGKVRLFYGAETGMELLYMNDICDDFSLYYDDATFKAFEAVSPRPHFHEPPAMGEQIEAHAGEIWEMLQEPNTYVYVAGLENVREQLEKAFVSLAGSEAYWNQLHERMHQEGRWSELLY